MSIKVPKTHPRYESIMLRHKMTESHKKGITAGAGLIAHGRGEAFDYLIGETTQEFAVKSIEAAAAQLIVSPYPVICVNGNSVVLSAKESVDLANACDGKIEVNLFYRTTKREKDIANELKKVGAKEILGVNLGKKAKQIAEIDHARRIIDADGIFKADTVFVPLEDGDRTQALRKTGKTVITIDLNPFSRTAKSANITIVDNITRAMPLLIQKVKELKSCNPAQLQEILDNYDNNKMLTDCVNVIAQQLQNQSFDS